MKRTFLFFILLSIMIVALKAQSITLDYCQEKASAHYPAIARFDIIEKTKNFDLKNASMAYLPQLSIGAQATWQSDVTKIDLDLDIPIDLNIDFPDKDQYKAVAEVSQLIWDGGKTSAYRKSIRATAEAEKHQLESEVYSLRERINNLYFGILLMDEQLELHTSLEQELERNYRNVESYIDNGVANQADLSAVKVEQLKAGQQRIELESTREAYLKMLSVLMGEQLADDVHLQKPAVDKTIIAHDIRRPELQMFDAQNSAIESQRQMLSANNLPVVALFAQGGYGRPALNMFKNEFTPYFIGGVKLSWNFGNLYTLSNDKKKIALQQQNLETQRESFLYNLSVTIPQQQLEIEKYRKTMQDDDEIIRLRKIIREAAEAKVENGTMTVSDLLKEVTAEEAAKQAKALHEIQFMMSVYNLKYTTNNK